jgi:hypothetical protein
MKRSLAMFMLVVPLLCSSTVCDADGFDSVRCGSDVRKALIGRKMSNETIVVLEERHKNLELKDLGASEISDRLNVISWRICGEEYVLLEDKDTVRDVVISETLKGIACIYRFLSIKWPKCSGHSDWCSQE